MKGKIKYTDEPIGKVKVIPDFVPAPEELALKEETVKAPIALSKSSKESISKPRQRAQAEQPMVKMKSWTKPERPGTICFRLSEKFP